MFHKISFILYSVKLKKEKEIITFIHLIPLNGLK